MTLFGALGFTAPWLLLGLLALPLLWILLRAVPPAPIRRRFPAVALLLGLRDEDHVSDRTPWWLLLLRMLAVAAVIVGLAGPVLNPRDEGTARATGPLLILMDGSWASARDWAARAGHSNRAVDGAAVHGLPLFELVVYIAERDPQAARRLRIRIEAAVSSVAEHPYLHQVGRLPGTREIVAHPNFIVVYQVTDRIEVISVVHSRQNYP